MPLPLDLTDKPRVVDFLAAAAPFAEGEWREKAEELIRRGPSMISEMEALDTAMKVALETWPIRAALETYITTDGKENEWDRVCADVSEKTAKVLNRLRKDGNATSLDETLAHPDADEMLDDGMRLEISDARQRAREGIWRDETARIKALIPEMQKHYAEYTARFESLRQIASRLPRSLKDEAEAKAMEFENRFVFATDFIPVEILDREIAYYREQKEISPLEE